VPFSYARALRAGPTVRLHRAPTCLSARRHRVHPRLPWLLAQHLALSAHAATLRAPCLTPPCHAPFTANHRYRTAVSCACCKHAPARADALPAAYYASPPRTASLPRYCITPSRAGSFRGGGLLSLLHYHHCLHTATAWLPVTPPATHTRYTHRRTLPPTPQPTYAALRAIPHCPHCSYT